MIIEKDTIIGDFKAFDYCYGRCHLFAIAAQEFFDEIKIKTEIFSFMEFDDPDIPELDCLDHAFIKAKGFFFDAHGKRDLNDIEAEYTANSFESELMDQDFFYQWFKEHSDKKYISCFAKNEKENIINFLKSIF